MSRLVRFQLASDRVPSVNPPARIGLLVDETLHDLYSLADFQDMEFAELLSNWGVHAPQVETKLGEMTQYHLDAPEVRRLCPVPEGGKILCIGLNYRDHAIESGMEIPTEPVVFNKLPGTLCGDGAEVPLPACSEQVDYEAELVIVIGKRAWQVSADAADEHIFGYCCGHDVSARDWQLGRPGGQWLLGKSFPHFAPLGPSIVTRDEVPEPTKLRISLRINGETLQDSTTAQLIYSPQQLIAHLSQCFVLEPGDVIFTGTPPGVGMARKPQRWIEPNDVCEVEIEGLGVLSNRFVSAN